MGGRRRAPALSRAGVPRGHRQAAACRYAETYTAACCKPLCRSGTCCVPGSCSLVCLAGRAHQAASAGSTHACSADSLSQMLTGQTAFSYRLGLTRALPEITDLRPRQADNSLQRQRAVRVRCMAGLARVRHLHRFSNRGVMRAVSKLATLSHFWLAGAHQERRSMENTTVNILHPCCSKCSAHACAGRARPVQHDTRSMLAVWPVAGGHVGPAHRRPRHCCGVGLDIADLRGAVRAARHGPGVQRPLQPEEGQGARRGVRPAERHRRGRSQRRAGRLRPGVRPVLHPS